MFAFAQDYLRPARLAVAALLCSVFAVSALARTLTPEGLGKVRIGMTVRQAEKALGEKLAGDGTSAAESCRYVHRSAGEAGVAYMVENGRITRIDVEPPAQGAPAKVTTA